MLIENTVFNFSEVGEKSFSEIKTECLVNFASYLKEALTSNNERIRKFWVENDFRGSIANYKIFQDLFGSKIKYNSKSIIFEETIYNNMNTCWSVRKECASVYGLEFVESSENQSSYYRFRKDGLKETCNTCCTEFVGTERDNADEKLRHFYEAFGVGEFPFITITVIRLGNKDHYFYSIHR